MFIIHTKIVSFCLLLFVCFVCCCFVFLLLFFCVFVVVVFGFFWGVIMKEYRCSLAALRVDLVVLNQTILNGFRY